MRHKNYSNRPVLKKKQQKAYQGRKISFSIIKKQIKQC